MKDYRQLDQDALIQACQRQDPLAAILIANENPELVNIKASNGDTLLMVAYKNFFRPESSNELVVNGLEAMKCFIDQGADVNASDRDGNSLMHMVVIEKNYRDRPNKIGERAIVLEIEKKVFNHKIIGGDHKEKSENGNNIDIAIAKMLIEKGADISIQNHEGDTPFSLSCVKRYEGLRSSGTILLNQPLTNFLIARGADVNEKISGNKKYSILSHALDSNFLELAKFYCDHGGGDSNLVRINHLEDAIRKNDQEKVKTLINLGLASGFMIRSATNPTYEEEQIKKLLLSTKESSFEKSPEINTLEACKTFNLLFLFLKPKESQLLESVLSSLLGDQKIASGLLQKKADIAKTLTTKIRRRINPEEYDQNLCLNLLIIDSLSEKKESAKTALKLAITLPYPVFSDYMKIIEEKYNLNLDPRVIKEVRSLRKNLIDATDKKMGFNKINSVVVTAYEWALEQAPKQIAKIYDDLEGKSALLFHQTEFKNLPDKVIKNIMTNFSEFADPSSYDLEKIIAEKRDLVEKIKPQSVIELSKHTGRSLKKLNENLTKFVSNIYEILTPTTAIHQQEEQAKKVEQEPKIHATIPTTRSLRTRLSNLSVIAESNEEEEETSSIDMNPEEPQQNSAPIRPSFVERLVTACMPKDQVYATNIKTDDTKNESFLSKLRNRNNQIYPSKER